jgi:hypothetical protein
MPVLHRKPGALDQGRLLIMPETDDRTLVAAAQGNPREFDALFVRYWGPVLRYCVLRLERRAASSASSRRSRRQAGREYHARA